MPRLYDRVKDTTSTAGTGPLVLDGAQTAGFRPFVSVVTEGEVFPYCIDDGQGNWEVGKGRMVLTGGDPYWAQVSELLHFDGADQSTTITSTKGLTWTVQGAATKIVTSQSKFGGASLSSVGMVNDIGCPDTVPFAFGTGDFTIEGWKYFTTITSSEFFFDNRVAGNPSGTGYIYCGFASGVCQVTSNGALIINSGSVSAGSWTHIAVTRSGGIIRFFVNGSMVASASDSIDYQSGGATIGGNRNNGISNNNSFTDDFRITKGVARYTTNFTPSITAFGEGSPSYSLVRDVIRSSSNNGNTVNFGAGSKSVFLTATAEQLDNSNLGMFLASRGMSLT